mmetsp:Transcript_28115/g.50643  ORF Transcript_28115/g.50643 Transcript_28115/m.50643 type:complete len:130 (-) Transcript_28115:27-416(-)
MTASSAHLLPPDPSLGPRPTGGMQYNLTHFRFQTPCTGPSSRVLQRGAWGHGQCPSRDLRHVHLSVRRPWPPPLVTVIFAHCFPVTKNSLLLPFEDIIHVRNKSLTQFQAPNPLGGGVAGKKSLTWFLT